MIPMELLSLGGGSILGFYLKYKAQQQSDLHAERMAMFKATELAHNAPDGIFIRRIIVLVMMAILAFIVMGPALLPEVKTILVEKYWFWTSTIEIDGIIYDSTIRSILLSIVGFYFGGSSAARR